VAKVLNIYEAKSQLSALVEEAAAGDEIIIAKAGVPRARLVPLRSRIPRRRPGGSEGRIWIAADFDAPLPDNLLDLFESRHDTATVVRSRPRRRRKR
jgi:prevent-host-death family protein